MKIGFAITGDVSKEFLTILYSFEDRINHLINDKSYGEDLYEMYVGIICVSPQFDQFFKVGGGKYQRERKEYIKEDVKYVLYKNFEYSIKLNYHLYKSLSGNELQEKLISEILNSFEILKTSLIKKKIKDFDSDLFLSDLEQLRNL